LNEVIISLTDAKSSNELTAAQKPWEEYQELMNTRAVVLMIMTIIPPVTIFQPVALGPITIGLLMRPMYLASQLISEMEELFWVDEYSIPDWFNSCVEESSQIVQDIASFQHSTDDAIH